MKAISLFSGGLDSSLAIKLIVDQGIDVIAMFVDTGFGGTKDKKNHLENMCRQIGAELRVVNIKDQFIKEILFNPKYGYGKNFNPCIDCHANMFRVGKVLMKEVGASFMISGEVLGQRPMSQRAESLDNVLKLSDADDLILRPLSAKLLTPTKPEREGWVDREKLMGISGRSREIQIKLAKDWGLEDYESPGGGCLLTDEHFSNRLRDFIAHDDLITSDIDLLKFGRHFRLPDGTKLIIGRNHEDNEKLENIDSEKYIELILPMNGPYSLLSKNASEKDKVLAAKIALTHTKSSSDEIYDVTINNKESIKVSPFNDKIETHKYLFNSKENFILKKKQ